MEQRQLTLGSLFDGIGGFPYAAIFYGIEPVWASEILPQAISVTRRHFPEMAHVGDITKIHGGQLPPVDIITFGSPCQDLSVAKGRRSGLQGERSGLFYEAIRIIKEMREATNGEYPTWAIWENVPGCQSSNGGRDFAAVLEAFAEGEVPLPGSGRWANAGMVRGGRADIAWILYGSEHFGVPQRRRRLFLVADFGGRRAGEVLFVRQSLCGYLAARGTAGQRVAEDAVRGAAGEGGGREHFENFLTPWDTQQARVFTGEGAAPTLAGADGGGGRNPAGLVYTANAQQLARTLTARGDSSPCADRGQNIVAVHQNQSGDVNTAKTAYSLTSNGNATGRNAPLVAHSSERLPEPIPIQDKATRGSGGGVTRNDDGCGNGLGIGKAGDPAPTITTGDRHAVAAVDCRNYKEVGDISGTLQAKNKPGYSLNFQNPVRTGYIVRRLTPTECERLQGFPDGWTEKGHDGKSISDTARYMMLGNSVAVPCVAYIFQAIVKAHRNRKEGENALCVCS